MTFPHYNMGFMKPKGYCAEYLAVYNAMTNKPSAADAAIQNTMLSALVDSGVYAKAELLDVFSAHSNTAGESQKNWKNPGTFNPILLGSFPSWIPYQGFTGSVTLNKYMSANFNPAINGTIIGQDNMCIIMGIGTNLQDNNYDIYNSAGGSSIIISAWRNTNIFGCSINSDSWGNIASSTSIGHFGGSRGNSANIDVYFNLSKTNKNSISSSLLNKNIVLLYSYRECRYFFLFSYLTEAEVTGVMGIMNTYLTNYGTNLY